MCDVASSEAQGKATRPAGVVEWHASTLCRQCYLALASSGIGSLDWSETFYILRSLQRS